MPELRTLCDPAEPRGGGGSASDCPSAPAAAELLHCARSSLARRCEWAVDPDGELADHVLARIAAILCLMFPEPRRFPAHSGHFMRKRRCAGVPAAGDEHDRRRLVPVPVGGIRSLDHPLRSGFTNGDHPDTLRQSTGAGL